MGIGRLRCHVIDVDDLAVAEAFWSEVTGLAVIPSVFPGRYSYLGQADPWSHEVILHLVRTPKGPDANRSHVDIWVSDVDRAIAQVQAIGGTLKRAPSIYPRPGSYPGEPPVIDWAVAQDPFGNEFCLIRVLNDRESEAVVAAGLPGTGDDAHWRAAATHARAMDSTQ
jgi:predicted enzyme related to lactoylglutathione lyase